MIICEIIIGKSYKTLKSNRDQLQKRANRKKNGATTSTVTKVNLKKFTAADIIAIRKKIKKEKARILKQDILLMILTLSIFFLIIWYFLM